MTEKEVMVKDETGAVEEESSIVSFEYEGITYTFDKEQISEDLDILEAFEEGKLTVPLKMVLGARQWNKFKSNKPEGVKQSKRLEEFVTIMFDTLGADLGE